MLKAIKTSIDRELKNIIESSDLKSISPLLFKSIKDFCLRDGKRIRPTLFVAGYLGFSQKPAANLYKSAAALELLHDFMLIHDDIIDKSDTRRGKLSMHQLFNNHLKGKKGIKFNGQDLAIVAGDVVYAMAINSFLSINENYARKEKALRNFIDATYRTGCGEFIELLLGAKNIEKITKQDIYHIYDYKTSYYTFAAPLSTGAILAGAKQAEVKKLINYAMLTGKAFQIMDDILGIFGNEKKIGKSTLSDLQEAKKTILIWYAYCNTTKKNKTVIKKISSKKNVSRKDLLLMQKIITDSGALKYAQMEVIRLGNQAKQILKTSKIKTQYKTLLFDTCNKLIHSV
ncbi:MAG: polyprenyl synthetase family protein [Candidatus Omnitrophica bacterium]|nr:polyprenyl synthetase family protein [Candidatus Omnitrophota bacterium]